MKPNQPLRVRSFVWTVDKKHNRTGWLPVGAPPNFYPGEGFMVAHDTVEHFGNKEGWDRELTAFGATLYGRAKHNEDMLKMVVMDFVNFLNEHEGWKIPKPKQAWKKPMPQEDEQWLTAFAALCKKYMHRRATTDCNCGQCKRMVIPANVDAILEDAVAWMRRGYKLARRLHHGRSGKEISELEERIADAVDELGTYDSLYDLLGLPQPHKVGDKLTVMVNRKANTFQLIHN